MEPAPRKPLVLVVDDRPENSRLLRAMLEAEGMEVQVAEDGEAAAEFVEGRVPDVILTDMHMPRLGGLGLVRRLKATGFTKNIPIVALSSSEPTQADETAALEAGCEGYYIRPLSRRQTMDIVQAALAKSALTSRR